MSIETSSPMHDRKSWLRATSWLLVGNLASAGVSAIVGIVLARSFGPRNLGVYSVATSISALLSIFSTLRMETHLVTRLDRSTADLGEYAATFKAALVAFVPLCAVTLPASFVVFDARYRLVACLCLLEVAIAPLLFARVPLQIRMRQPAIVLCALVGRATWVAMVGGLLALNSATVAAVVGARVLASIVEGLLLHRLGDLSLIRVLRRRVDLRTLAAIIRSSLPLAASGLTGEAYSRFDQPLVGALRGPREVGFYGAGVRVAELTGVHSPIIQSVVLPGLVDHHRSGDRTGAARAIRDGLLLSLLPGGVFVAAAISQSRWLAATLLGPAYHRSASIIAVLALAEWFTFVGTAYGAALIAEDRRGTMLAANLLGLPANVGLNLAFVPMYGGLAAAWSSVAAYGLVAGVLMLGSPALRREARAGFALILRCAAITAVGVAVGKAGPSNLLINQSSAIAIQGLAACLLFPEDARRVVSLVRRLGRRAVR